MLNFKRGMVIEVAGKQWQVNDVVEQYMPKVNFLTDHGIYETFAHDDFAKTSNVKVGDINKGGYLVVSVLHGNCVSLNLVSYPPVLNQVRWSLSVSDTDDVQNLTRHASMLTGGEWPTHYVHVSQVRIISEPPQKIKGLTKPKLMAYVVRKYGEMSRDDILRKVAEISGTPYVKTSNKSYFVATGKGSTVVESGVLIELRKEGNKIIYGLGPNGHEYANEATQLLSESNLS